MSAQPIIIQDAFDRENLQDEAWFGAEQPVLLRGLVKDWPVVKKSLESPHACLDYVQQFDQDIHMTVYRADHSEQGRIFYNEDMTGFNFDRLRMSLSQVSEALLSNLNNAQAPSYYIGSTMIDHWLPGFRSENDLNLGDRESLVSMWLGNRSRIAAHYDFPNNIACVLAGRRKFTLFPPEQADNLYVGPLEFTPSGQAISLVDTCEPDLKRFPKYAQAQDASISVELEPGDAIYIPGMWWHHVESLAPVNVLVNYWWRPTPAYHGAPLNALQHAIMSLRDLPVEQRLIWKDIFDRYVFSAHEQSIDHIPEHARGVLAGVDEQAAQAIRAQLLKFLK